MESKRRKFLDAETVARWLVVRDQEGLTFAQLSERSGITARKLTWWSGRLRKSARPGFARVDVKDEDELATEFVVKMRVRLRSGHAIELGNVFDRDALVCVAKALESC